jgi:hypothetical protein
MTQASLQKCILQVDARDAYLHMTQASRQKCILQASWHMRQYFAAKVLQKCLRLRNGDFFCRTNSNNMAGVCMWELRLHMCPHTSNTSTCVSAYLFFLSFVSSSTGREVIVVIMRISRRRLKKKQNVRAYLGVAMCPIARMLKIWRMLKTKKAERERLCRTHSNTSSAKKKKAEGQSL